MRRVIVTLLRLFPAGFRREFSESLLETFEHQWRERRGWPQAVRTITDLVRSAFCERLAEFRRNHKTHGYTPPKGDSLVMLFLQEIRYALRTLLKNPGYSLIAAITLTLGIGANTTIFSVVNAVLLKGLPYPHAERLVHINESLPKVPGLNVSWPDFVDWRAQNQVFDDMAVFQDPGRTAFRGAGRPKSLPATWVSSSFFTLLGAETILGRTFGESDDKPGAAPVAVVSYRVWRNELKGDPEIVGKSIVLESDIYTVTGVLSPDFRFQRAEADFYLPVGLRSKSPAFANRANHPGLTAIARLRSGISLDRARGEMDTIMTRLAQSYPQSNRNKAARVRPLAEQLLGNIRPQLWMLLGAVAFVLLIACANVAHLALARGAARQREFAIRAAIGASRARLAGKLLAESLLLSVASGAAGLLLAGLSLPAFVKMYPGAVPGLKEASLDWSVFSFTLVVCLVTGVIFGFAPMVDAVRAGVNSPLKEGAGGRHGQRLRSVLFVAEIAFAMVLAVGAGLLLRSLKAVLDINPGFRADHLLALDVVHPRGGGLAGPLFFERVIQQIHQLPGVKSASAVFCPPFSGTTLTSPFVPEGESAPPLNQRPWTAVNLVMPDYFETIGAHLVEGRLFTPDDGVRTRNLAIVNRTMARRAWPNGPATGNRLRVTYAPGEVLEVIGVVDDLTQRDLEGRPMPEVFVPAAQLPVTGMTIVVRTTVDPAGLALAVEGAIQSVDKDQPVARITPMTRAIAQSVSQRKFAASLLGLFGTLALVLAAVGVSGVMAYTVAQRTREFGIRMAIGAQRGEVLRLVLRRGLVLTALGVAIGGPSAWAVARLLSAMLFHVRPYDPVTFAGVAALLAAVALGACLLPARRAASVDPVRALRYE